MALGVSKSAPNSATVKEEEEAADLWCPVVGMAVADENEHVDDDGKDVGEPGKILVVAQ